MDQPPECPAPKKEPKSDVFRMAFALERKVLTPEAASLLLFAAFVFGIVSTGLILVQEEATIDTPDSVSGPLAGYVYSDNGTPIDGAVVRIRELDIDQSTNDNGYYYFDDVPPGEYDLVASALDHTTAIKRISLDGLQPKRPSFSLPLGQGTITQDETDPLPPPSFAAMQGFVGGIFLFGTICALLAAVFAYQRRTFKITLSLAVLATLSYGFLVGSVLAGMAALFIMAEKRKYGCAPTGLGEASETDMVCSKCDTHIFPIEPYVECRCGNIYHLDCVKTGSCPKCEQAFTGL